MDHNTDETQVQNHVSQYHEASEMVQQRRSANYKPNIWNYEFLQSLSSKSFHEEGYRREAVMLKEHVRHMFIEADDVLSKLVLVDSIQKLGLASHFQDEIKLALATVASMVKTPDFSTALKQNLCITALCFRLLRQHGYEVSQDMFSGLLDDKGCSFMECKCTDTEGVVELFEAAHLALKREKILEEAKHFSTTVLKKRFPSLESRLANRVRHTLELPSHWRVNWFDARWQIHAYENEPKELKLLTRLAKVNFNIVQAALQQDLRDISRWWKNLGLVEKLDFSRDRLVESFLCSVGVVSDPQYSSARKWLTKVIVMILVIDDVYDVYGSLEELQQFTQAVNRWDPREVQTLPECMRACFQALYDITNQSAEEMETENDWIQVHPHLKKVWADFCNALFAEAKWYHAGSIPSLEEYLKNGLVSSSGPLLFVHSFFSIMSGGGTNLRETNNFLGNNQGFLQNVSMIIRLCNDLGTSVAEQERGDVASSIVCYMKEENVSEEVARSHVNGIISKCWKKINGQSAAPSPSLQLLADGIRNMARVVHNLYQHGDGFGVQDRDENKKQILGLLVQHFRLHE